MTKQVLTFSQKLEIANVITAHADKIEGMCAYHPGWNDERVQIEAAPKVALQVVRNLRKQIMGPIRPKGKAKSPGPKMGVEERFRRLETSVVKLIGEIEKLKAR